MVKVIKIIGKITKKTAEMVLKELDEQSYTGDLTIYIDSPGGEVTETFTILDALEKLQGKITTVALADCESAATLIFFMGHTRYLIKECNFMMHRPGYTLDGIMGTENRLTLPVLEERIKLLKDDDEKIKQFFRKHNVSKKLIQYIFSSTKDIIVKPDTLIEDKMADDYCHVTYVMEKLK